MKAAATAVQAALQPMGRTADALRGAVEQLGGVAQRLQDAQAATARLMEGATQATGRFEGVDRALAATLAELQKGLKGFTDQIRGFVVETDGNLAKAATQLGNLTKELDATLGDFLDRLPPR
jgi:ABC-type transporter Mla subunit MlaD